MAEEDGASFNLAWPARVFGALIGTGRDRLAARWTDDAGLAPQPRGRPHHAIAAARANEFDLGGIFQRMVGQSSPSANGELGLAIPQTLLVAADEVIECISRVHRVSRLSGIGLVRQAWIGERSPVTR